MERTGGYSISEVVKIDALVKTEEPELTGAGYQMNIRPFSATGVNLDQGWQ
jgi:hypothetical protein